MITEILELKKILVNIDYKISNNQELNFEEKEIFCIHELKNEKENQHLSFICEDFKFMNLYRTYITDLSFNSEYYKVAYDLDLKSNYEVGKITEKSNDYLNYNDNFSIDEQNSYIENLKNLKFLRKVDINEIAIDKNYLEKVSIDWQKTIDITNHIDQKLKDSAEETRQIIREIKKKLKYKNHTDSYIIEQIKITLWKSKFVHLLSLQISEQIEIKDKFPYKLFLNGKSIYFTFKTLIHILNRHFAHIASSNVYQNSKSHHSPIFKPENIHLVLKDIFKKLNISSEFKNDLIEIDTAYNLNYKKIDYQFYLVKFENEKLRISSIYPVLNEDEKNKLIGKRLVKIDNQLSIYKNGS